MPPPTWFTELEQGCHGLTIREDRVLVDTHTSFQRLKIFENAALGRVMLLDDVVMLTERDEFAYHEMLVHPGLLAHPRPARVLIVGGGDGGTLREVVKHPEVERATLCEIDGEVIDYSREFLPFTATAFDNPVSRVVVGDGLEFMRAHESGFDVVIVDSTDPVGMAEGLFRSPFFRDVRRALRPGGIMVQQTESPFFEIEPWMDIFSQLTSVFSSVRCYGAAVPMYPSGYWTFAFAADSTTPWEHFDEERAARLPSLRYYEPDLQQAAFALPRFVREMVRKAGAHV